MPRQLPWKRGRAGRGPGIHPYPARRHRASGTRLPRPRLARKRSLKSPGVPSDQPPRAEPRAPGARLAAATAGAGPGRGRRIQDGGGQEEASSPVGGKGKSVAATPPAACAPGRGSRGHCRLPVGVHTGAAGGGGATVYLRSPSLHLSAPLLLLIFHVPSGPCRVAREATGPTRRRLRSIYTPSPFVPARPPLRQLSRRRGPAPRLAPPLGVRRRPRRQSGATFLHSCAFGEVRPKRSSAPAGL